MKITSGRIQRAGINPNSGKSLGFYGVGALGQAVDANGLPITGSSLQDLMNLSATYGANASGPDYIDSNTGQLISGATGMVITPTLTAASGAPAGAAPAATQQPFQWGALLMGLGALCAVVLLVKK